MKEIDFLKLVATMGKTSLDDFSYELEGNTYAFKDLTRDNWVDEGKYQYKTEKGRLIMVDSEFNILKVFNFGVSRVVQRSGSYFSDYYYTYEDYVPFEIIEVLVPEVVIPAHIEKKEVVLKIPQSTYKEIESEYRAKEKELEKQRKLEEEEKVKQEELRQKYSMNDRSIIQMVSTLLKKRGLPFNMKDMQLEYFKIVEKECLKDEDWLEYHRNNTLKEIV